MNDKENTINVARAIIRIGDAAEKAKDYGLLKSLEEMVDQLTRHNVKTLRLICSCCWSMLSR